MNNMEVPIELGESRQPLSPVFVDFLSRWLEDGARFTNENWFDQLSESLSNMTRVMRQRYNIRLERLLTDGRGQKAISRAYRWFYDLLSGSEEALESLHNKYNFIAIVGLGRTGGSYLTAEIFSSLGYDPTTVPAVVAHDGFPNAQPLSKLENENAWISSIMGMSEYLTMVELYFDEPVDRPRMVPKKLTKAVYAGGFFNAVLGPNVEYVVTVRHPIANCISTYDKSGGLPGDGKMKTRSNIETWIRRDLLATGLTGSEFEKLEYFEAYARYWEQYHINLALSGLLSHRPKTVVAFGKSRMERAASSFHSRYNSGRIAANFVSTPGALQRHGDWLKRSEQAIARVEGVWNLVGLPFPSLEIQEGL